MSKLQVLQVGSKARYLTESIWPVCGALYVVSSELNRRSINCSRDSLAGQLMVVPKLEFKPFKVRFAAYPQFEVPSCELGMICPELRWGQGPRRSHRHNDLTILLLKPNKRRIPRIMAYRILTCGLLGPYCKPIARQTARRSVGPGQGRQIQILNGPPTRQSPCRKVFGALGKEDQNIFRKNLRVEVECFTGALGSQRVFPS